VYVPAEDLPVLLESSPQRVFLTRQEYADLQTKAKKTPPKTPAPQGAVLLSAAYSGTIENERARITGTLAVEVLEDGLHALPLELGGVGVRAATWEKDQTSAAVGLSDKGQPTLLVSGVGRQQLILELVAPVPASAAQQTLAFQLPVPPATRLDLTVPGNVEMKSGAQVIARKLDEAAGVTRFTLLPPRGAATLVMSLNNRILRQQRVVVARSVLVDEVTSAYERLHATVSFDILHGAADRFRFALPEGFEPTEVLSPLLARWVVVPAPGPRTLEVFLREPTTEKVVVNLSATRTPARLAAWQMPQLKPLDVVGQVAVVGLIVEDRLKAEALADQGLIAIDNAVLTAALPDTVFRAEPGAPRVVPVAAFYAPQEPFALQGRFIKPPGRLKVTTNLLLILDEQGQRLQGGFLLQPEGEKCFDVMFSVPRPWHVTQVTTLDGKQLATERFEQPDQEPRLHVRLPQGVAPGETTSLTFEALSVPAGWLGEWQRADVTFPKFVVDQTSSDEGAIAIRAAEDFLVRPDVLEQLSPLDENEKPKYGLKDVASNLAYRYDGQPYRALLAVERKVPTITARCFSFLKLAPEGLTAHYEILYHVQQARARRLSLVLPAETPQSLAIVGLDGAAVKEFTSADTDEGRRWTALLADGTAGEVRLAVDFQQPLADHDLEQFRLPLVRADGVEYQSAVVAVEGSAELDIDVHTGARKLDVGELVAAKHRVGRRLLGTFGFVGPAKTVTVDIHRRPGCGLPPAIVQRAELLTVVSTNGVSQNSARYQLRTKPLFLEIKLPAASKLWSILLDNSPVAPQRDNADNLLLSLSASEQSQTRDLRILYETPVRPVHLIGNLRATAPQLSLRADREAAGAELPTADLKWDLVLPASHRLLRANGTVFTELPDRQSPVWNVLGAVYKLLGGTPGPEIVQVSMTLPSPYHYWSGKGKYYAPPAASSEGAVERFEVHDAGEEPTQLATDTATLRESAPRAAELAAPAEKGGFAYQPADAAGQAVRGALGRGGRVLRGPASAPRGGEGGGAPGMGMMGGMLPPAKPAPASPAMMPPGAGGMPGLPGYGAPPSEAPLPAKPEPPAPPVGAVAAPEPPPPTNQPPAVAAGTEVTVQPPLPPGGDRFWALEGLRSLPIDFDPAGQRLAFHSLGAKPQLLVRLADVRQMRAVAWAVGLLVFLVGVCLTGRSARCKTKYVLVVGVLALVVPLVTGLVHELGEIADGAFYAAACLVLYYLVVAFCGWCVRRPASAACPVAAPSASALLIAVLLVPVLSASAVAAEPAPAKPALDPAVLQELLEATQPVKLPEDAVIIPYDADQGEAGVKNAEEVLVPYAKYVELWNRAFPDKQREAKPPVVPFALAGAEFRTTLTGDEFLALAGHVMIDVFTDKAVQVPLRLSGGVLTAATVAGQPARLQFVQPAPRSANQPPAQGQQVQQAQTALASQSRGPAAEPFALLHLTGKGRHRLELTVRLGLQREGGWRVVAGRLPTAPATALIVTVPAARTEVRFTGLADRANYETAKDQEAISTALSADGSFQLRWRPKAAEAQVDRSLTVHSDALLDVQEDGLRLAWRLNLEFPRSRRDSFSLLVPGDYLVEKVVGGNIRSWEAKPAEKQQRLDIVLLKETPDRESVTVQLSRRGAIAAEGTTQFDAPVVSVEGAVLHKGRVTVRRSPLLEVRALDLAGVSRTDVPAEAAGTDKPEAASESPLVLRPFQAYEFAATPFTLTLTAAPVASEATASVQTLLKISERETTLESRVLIQVQRRPVHRVRLAIPATLVSERVTAPGDFQWAVVEDQGRRILTVYLTAGQPQPFEVTLVGSLGRRQATAPVAAPTLHVLDVRRQQGDVVVQVDPGFDVRATGLQKCESVLLNQTHGWLKPEQRALARLALRYQTPDYQATFELTPRRPRVNGFTVTNVKVTDVAVEETIILDLTIHEAGIREVSFLVPDWLERARVKAPMLRQKHLSEATPGWKRFRLELQDEVMGQYRVLLEHERLLRTEKQAESELHEAPIPVLKTGRTDQRYVTLENASGDELLPVDQKGLQPLGREQAEWRKLAAIAGETLTTAYLVAGDAAEPKLSFKTKQRQMVQTAGAQIGRAETLLVVDASGAYRGRQEYRVHNTTEQFLVVRLPAGASLWTATVSGEPVKPTELPGGTTPDQLRIPLIKTADGELDYPVVLKYGGQMSALGLLGRLEFPLPHTEKISVESSNVRLRLPETHRWWYFGGTMRQVSDESEYQAEFFSYNRKQIGRLMDVWKSENPYARARVNSNLRQMGLALQNYHDTYRTFPQKEVLRKSLAANIEAVQQAEEQTQQYLAQEQREVQTDNRGRFHEYFDGQGNALAKNVVQDLGRNFDAPAVVEAQPQSGEQRAFDFRWLARNQLETKQQAAPAEQQRYGFKGAQLKGQKAKELGARQLLLQNFAGKEIPKDAQAADGKSQVRVAPLSQKSLARAYQQQLENEAAQQPAPQPAQQLEQSVTEFDQLRRNAVAEQKPTQATTAPVDPFGQPAGASRRGQVAQGPGATPGMPKLGDDARGQTVMSDADVSNLSGLRVQTGSGGVAATTHLASLDVDLPEGGQEFLFTTPRGDIAITAQAISALLVNRVQRLLMLVLGVLLLLVAGKLLCLIAARVRQSLVVHVLLLLIGLFSLLGGLFPIAGLIVLIASALQIIRLARRPRVAPG
jgi:hypothetical protein